MFLNQSEIENIAERRHDCPNVRKGVKLLSKLMHAVNEQSSSDFRSSVDIRTFHIRM